MLLLFNIEFKMCYIWGLMCVAKRIREGLMYKILLTCHTWLQYKDKIEFLIDHHYNFLSQSM